LVKSDLDGIFRKNSIAFRFLFIIFVIAKVVSSTFYVMESSMSLLDTIGGAQEFATLPPVAGKVLSLLENANADVREITNVLETDPALTLKILQMANSPLYAIRSNVTSLQQAVLALGLIRVANIVLSVSIFSKFILLSRSKSAEHMKKFWYHSSCTGMVAKNLAVKIKRNFNEVEFIGGLLHDIGKMAMIQFDPENYEKVVQIITEEHIPDTDAELRVYGVDHLVVGELIARLWKLPKELQYIAGHHNDASKLTESHKEVVALVRVADILCEMWGASIDEGIFSVDLSNDNSWQILCDFSPHLKDLDLELFTFELETEFRQAASFLNMVASDASSK
jgi:putative nucleotidyltransferase with HDIG domain